MNKILFVDLDDTLFQTLAKYSGDPALEPVAYYISGEPCSYTTEKQRFLFELFQSNMIVVPTTARDMDAFARVNLSFTSYTICNFGGVILNPDGEINAFWREKIIHQIAALTPVLQELIAEINDFCISSGFPGRAKMVSDSGMDFYLVIKDPEKKLERLEIIEREIISPWLKLRLGEFFIHRNANNLAVVPTAINKSHAVEYVISLFKQEFGQIMTFGMGDSKSDAKFMALCDYSIVPKNSQLSSHLEQVV